MTATLAAGEHPTPSGVDSRRADRRRLRRVLVLFYVTGVVLILAKAFFAGRLVVNRTSSVPRGIYWLARDAAPERGAIVAFPIPEHVRPLFRERALVPSPFFELLAKPVAAGGGDHVCIRAGELFINDRFAAPVSPVDSQRREMPHVSLCRRLAASELFVLTSTESFDSRYLGPIPTVAVRGTLTLLIAF